MKCVHFAVHVKISSSHVLSIHQTRLTTKLRIVIGSMKTKIVVKFEASGMLNVEMRAIENYEMCTLCKSDPHTY